MGNLSKARWDYIKALRPSPGRLVHQSVVVIHTPAEGKNPAFTHTEKRTFFDFRNARKAAYREDAQRTRREGLKFERMMSDLWLREFLA